jgi:uncharacterized coiled-coil DUF342 family protein
MSQESNLFVSERDIFGNSSYYSKSLLWKQRGRLRAEDIKDIVRGEIEEVMGDVVLELDNIVCKHVTPLHNELKDLRCDMKDLKVEYRGIRDGLLSLNNGEGLCEVRELWMSRMQRLETLIQSTSCDESKIAKEMKGLAKAFESKLFDLDEQLDAAGVVNELTKLRSELISIHNDRGRK